MNVMLPRPLPLSLHLSNKAIQFTLKPFDNLGLQLDDAGQSVLVHCISGKVVVSVPNCWSMRHRTPLIDIYLSAGQNLTLDSRAITKARCVWISTFENAEICLSQTLGVVHGTMLGTMCRWIQMQLALQFLRRRLLSLRPRSSGLSWD
jgi:hypothetical protein